MRVANCKSLTVVLLSLFLISCGGGGGGSTTTTPVVTTPEPTTPEPTSLKVTAVDGYLQNARIYIDLNENYQFDETEPNGMTDSLGQVTFSLADITGGLLKPIIVEAIAGQTVDLSNGLAVTESYSMVAPPGSEVVSPLTTLAQLTLVKGQHADIESAISAIKTQLGLSADANIMADYLSTTDGNETLYAVARSIVALLPEQPATLFADSVDSETINALMDTAGNIATAVNDAIAGGATPGSIFVTIAENGGITASELTMEDAMAFIADVQVWSDAVSFDFIHAASNFSYKIQAAAQVAQADTTELMTMLAHYSQGGLVALTAGLHREMDAGLFVAGSTGTVTTSLNQETQVDMVVIDAQLDDKAVVATITLTDFNSTAATLVANLDSNKVTIVVSQGSALMLDSETYMPETMTLNASVSTKTDDDMVSPVHFSGSMMYYSVALEKSDGTSVYAPSQFSLSGIFDVNGQESFEAGLFITMTSQLIDDVLNVSDLNVTLQLGADFIDVPEAYMQLDVAYTQNSGTLALTLIYGERMITLAFANNGDASEVKITNAMGMTLVLDLAVPNNAENRGVIVMGIEQIATIDKVDGHYVVTFNDGSTITLF